MDLFDKCLKIYEQTQGLRTTGHYFFFRKLESPQDAEVVVDGKRVIMMCKFLFENGVFVNPVVSPAVPPGRELLRTSYMEDPYRRAVG